MSRLILMGIFVILAAAHNRLERKHEMLMDCYINSSYSLDECISFVALIWKL